MTFCFACGSNLDTPDRAAWSQERGVPDPLARAAETATLPAHELAFNHGSHTRWEGVRSEHPPLDCDSPGPT